MEIATRPRGRRFVAAASSILLAGGVMLTMPGVAHALFPDIEAGILIDEVPHELPAPAVSLASTGQSLVVYLSARPDDTDNDFCGESGAVSNSPGPGEGCVIIGRIVSADRETVSMPFVVSGDIPIDYYQVAPSVTWNETHSEWLVLFHSRVGGFVGTYAQRVSTEGTLEGSQVTLPSATVTSITDRSDTTDLTSVGTLLVEVQAVAEWSEAANSYLVVWTVRDPGLRWYVLGYLVNRSIESVDGVNAPFFISDPGFSANFQGTALGFSPDKNQWLVTYAYTDTDLLARAFRVDGSAVSASEEFTVRGVHPDETDRNLAGGIVWVSSEEAWLVAWSERRNYVVDGDPVEMWNAFGKYVTGDQFEPGYTLSGERFPLTDYTAFFEEEFDPATVIHAGALSLAYDSESNIVHGAGHLRHFDGINLSEWIAASWTYDVSSSSTSSATTLVSPRLDSPSDGESSRPQVSSFGGGVVTVYQNWPNGGFEDPSEVRFVSVSVGDSTRSEGGETRGSGSTTPSSPQSEEREVEPLGPTLAATGPSSIGPPLFLVGVAALVLGLAMSTRGYRRESA